jgi:hypothetical protein
MHSAHNIPTTESDDICMQSVPQLPRASLLARNLLLARPSNRLSGESCVFRISCLGARFLEP